MSKRKFICMQKAKECLWKCDDCVCVCVDLHVTRHWYEARGRGWGEFRYTLYSYVIWFVAFATRWITYMRAASRYAINKSNFECEQTRSLSQIDIVQLYMCVVCFAKSYVLTLACRFMNHDYMGEQTHSHKLNIPIVRVSLDYKNTPTGEF